MAGQERGGARVQDATKPSAIRVGLKLASHLNPIEVHRVVWRIADESGFDHLWNTDHLLAAAGPDPESPVFEAWSMLAAMAEVTRRIRIGVMVTGNAYRHPGLLAKMGATIDHLSGGRLEMGIGAGWNEPEFVMLGMPFPSTADRIRMLDEACVIIDGLWTQDRTTFEGSFYQLVDAISEPKPLQRPRPPIWIGGSGATLTLRVVARRADVWNADSPSVEEEIAASNLLDEHCRAVGRDPSTIRRSAQIAWAKPEEAVSKAAQYRKAGFTDLIIKVAGPDARSIAEVAALQILPRIRELD